MMLKSRCGNILHIGSETTVKEQWTIKQTAYKEKHWCNFD